MSKANSAVLRRSPLAAALFAALLVPGMALAQDQQQSTEQDEDATEIDKVVVTGSRIKRVEVEGPAPVTVITAAEIERQGYSTVYDALNTLTQFTGSVQNELNQNGFTPNASFLNLRGLGPGYQLILINGRRAADYPRPYNSQSNAVNLANIPAAAIDRIEVLSGGASAIYGSDAVAGVVNVILKTNYEGDQLSLRAGTTTRGGGDTARLQWVGGKTGDNWSLTYAFEALEREEIFASQRDFMDSYYDQPATDRDDINPVEGLLVIDAITSNRIFGEGNPAAADVCGRFSAFEIYHFEASAVYTGPRCGYPGYPATQAIRNSDSNYSGYLYGTLDFDNGMQAFAQVSLTSSEAKLASNTQFWSSEIFFDPTLTSDALPFGAFVQTQRIFTPEEVGRNAQITRFDERSYDVAAGVRGTIFDGRFDWDATLSHANYKLDIAQPRFLENPLNAYFLGPQLGLDPYFGAYPVYDLNDARYYNPIDPAAFATLNTIVRSSAESEVSQASFVFSGDLFDLPAGPLSMAAVLEGARQSYELHPDPRTLPSYTGNEPIYNLTDTGGGGERDRYALGVEFSIPVLESLSANVAGRYDKYDDATQVDDAVTWQVGLEWRPVESLLIRGSRATSFRAPDMHYVFADESGFFITVFDEYRCRRDGFDPTAPNAPCAGSEYNYSVFGTRRGSTELEEETGTSMTAGFVWDITDDISVSVDYYKIELEGAVSDISTAYLFRNEADCLLGERRDGSPVDPNSAACQFFTGLVTRTGVDAINDDEIDTYLSLPFNQSLARTSGIDASLEYSLDTDRLGDFKFELGYSHVLTYDYEEFPGDGIRDIRDDPQYFNFRSRINGSAVWRKDDWTTGVYYTRWGSLPNWAETGRIAPYILWNVNVAKKVSPNLTLGVYVNNVFDKLAPRDDTFDTYPYFWRAYSPIGREVFVQLDYRFD